MLAILDDILSRLWVQFYYRKGVEIYRQRTIIPEVKDITSGLEHLSHLKIKRGFVQQELLQFHELGTNYYALRTVPGCGFISFSLRSSPNVGLMRRCIIFNPETNELTLIGRLNWWLVVWVVSLMIALIGGLLDIGGNLIQAFFTAFIFFMVILGTVFLIGIFSYFGEVKLNRLIETSLLQYFRKEQKALESKQPQL
jgi:hypothetical protein